MGSPWEGRVPSVAFSGEIRGFVYPRVRGPEPARHSAILHADRSDVSGESGRGTRKAAFRSQRLRLVCERRIRLRWHPGPLRGLYGHLVGTRQREEPKGAAVYGLLPDIGRWTRTPEMDRCHPVQGDVEHLETHPRLVGSVATLTTPAWVDTEGYPNKGTERRSA